MNRIEWEKLVGAFESLVNAVVLVTENAGLSLDAQLRVAEALVDVRKRLRGE